MVPKSSQAPAVRELRGDENPIPATVSSCGNDASGIGTVQRNNSHNIICNTFYHCPESGMRGAVGSSTVRYNHIPPVYEDKTSLFYWPQEYDKVRDVLQYMLANMTIINKCLEPYHKNEALMGHWRSVSRRRHALKILCDDGTLLEIMRICNSLNWDDNKNISIKMHGAEVQIFSLQAAATKQAATKQ
ncbi:hypothetical protein TrVGV298_000613 [Trichoderma virens]|nr:hypothetical protein TrVGV298_000613 [Trichoderma virens]